jgi:hypothetical protein
VIRATGASRVNELPSNDAEEIALGVGAGGRNS